MINPIEMLKPCRKITGISAILLPFTENHEVDWDGFCAHVARTAEAGIIPAINMDTGYANLIDEGTRREALARTQETLGNGAFTAGAFVGDKAGDSFNKAAYFAQVEQIQSFGGMPIIFQSFGLTSLSPAAMLEAYAEIGKTAPQFIAFELGTMFAPFGKIYDLETYAGLLEIEACIGAKHSSLNRELEWQRILLRDEKRPDFKVFTGNDLAIDMVMYGSDYLLGLSTFAPDLFAKRDAYWLSGDPAFYELNDKLQYLGFFAFRQPVPAYKHSAAQFLKLRGWIKSNETHPKAPSRPSSDIEVLRELAQSLGILEAV
jgi:dihydrodipicolinate synthase/N-acetylneuraminate lyase